jgi:2-methylcitrate dehydratase PrpD
VSIARELARFLTSPSAGDLPPLALERARMAIASTIASAAMGSDIVSARIIRELAMEHGRRGAGDPLVRRRPEAARRGGRARERGDERRRRVGRQ